MKRLWAYVKVKKKCKQISLWYFFPWITVFSCFKVNVSLHVHDESHFSQWEFILHFENKDFSVILYFEIAHAFFSACFVQTLLLFCLFVSIYKPASFNPFGTSILYLNFIRLAPLLFKQLTLHIKHLHFKCNHLFNINTFVCANRMLT